jgi:hypothetical protein
MSEPTFPVRSTSNCAWCWQDKAARRLIREMFDASGNVPSALLFYDALTEIASDEQSETFTTMVGHIAEKAGISRATIHRLEAPFEELKLVAIQRNERPGSKLKAPSTYTLLPISHGETSMSHGRKQKRSRERVEESPEESKKNVAEETKAPSEAATTTNFEELLAELRPLYLNNNVDREYEHCVSWYREHKRGAVTPRRFRKWMKDAEPELRRSKAKAAIKSPAPPPIDPVKEADFLRRLSEWKAKGRPLGVFPTS